MRVVNFFATLFFVRRDKINQTLPVRDQINIQIKLRVKEIMDGKKLGIAKVSQVSGLRYETVKSYYENTVVKYDRVVLAIFCATLNCNIGELYEII